MTEVLKNFKSLGGREWVSDGMLKAAKAILEWSNTHEIKHRKKSDGSPVSDADILSEKFLRGWISQKSEWPIVSEETPVPEKIPEIFWLIDPLDGTREFIHGIPEYTINVALIENGVPVFGAITEPESGKLWTALKGEGITRLHSHKDNNYNSDKLRIAISRFHNDPNVLALFPDAEYIERGSAGKFALLADNDADLYIRIGRTMEWDTGAGHCLLSEANCELLTLTSQDQLIYGKPKFENTSFVAYSTRVKRKVDDVLEKFRRVSA